MKKIVFLFASILFLSCHQRSQPSVGEAIPIPDTSSVVADTSTMHLNEKIYKGLFASGKNIRSFRDCNNPDQNIWILGREKLDSLYQKMKRDSLTFPAEYAYVEVRGIMTPADDDSRKKGFDNDLMVKEVLVFEQKNFRNTCIPYEFWGIGNEPNWSLQISKREDLIALKDFSDKQVYLFPYFEPDVMNDEIFTYRTENTATSNSLQVVIRKQPCNDAKSNNDYEYSAQVILNGKVFRGCAIKGDSLPY